MTAREEFNGIKHKFMLKSWNIGVGWFRILGGQGLDIGGPRGAKFLGGT